MTIGRVSFWTFPGQPLGRRSLYLESEVGGAPQTMEKAKNTVIRGDNSLHWMDNIEISH